MSQTDAMSSIENASREQLLSLFKQVVGKSKLQKEELGNLTLRNEQLEQEVRQLAAGLRRNMESGGNSRERELEERVGILEETLVKAREKLQSLGMKSKACLLERDAALEEVSSQRAQVENVPKMQDNQQSQQELLEKRTAKFREKLLEKNEQITVQETQLRKVGGEEAETATGSMLDNLNQTASGMFNAFSSFIAENANTPSKAVKTPTSTHDLVRRAIKLLGKYSKDKLSPEQLMSEVEKIGSTMQTAQDAIERDRAAVDELKGKTVSVHSDAKDNTRELQAQLEQAIKEQQSLMNVADHQVATVREELRQALCSVDSLTSETANKDGMINELLTKVAMLETGAGNSIDKDVALAELQNSVHKLDSAIYELQENMNGKDEIIAELRGEIGKKERHIHQLENEAAVQKQTILELQAIVNDNATESEMLKLNSDISSLNAEIISKNGEIVIQQEEIAAKNEKIVSLQDHITDKEFAVTDKEDIINRKDAIITENESVITEKDAIISEKEQTISEKDDIISEKEQTISEKEDIISEKAQTINEKEDIISKKDAIIMELRSNSSDAAVFSSQINQLQDQAKNMEDEILDKANSISLLNGTIVELQSNVDTRNKEIALLKQSANEQKNTISQLQNDLSCKNDMFISKDNEIVVLNKKIELILGAQDDESSIIKSLQAEITTKHAEISHLYTSKHELELLLETKQGETEARDVIVRELEKEVANMKVKESQLEYAVEHATQQMNTELSMKSSAIEQLNNDINDLKIVIENLNKDILAKNAIITQLESSSDALTSDNKAALEQLRTEVSNKESEIMELQSEMNSKNETISQLHTVISTKDEEINQLTNDVTSTNEKVLQLNTDVTVKDNTINELNNTITKNSEEINELGVDITKKTEEISQLHIDITTQNNEINQLNIDLDNKSNETTQLATEINRKNNEINQLSADISDRNAQLSSSLETNTIMLSLEAKVAELQSEINDLHTQSSLKDSEISSFKSNIDALQTVVQRLEDTLSKKEETMSYNVTMITELEESIDNKDELIISLRNSVAELSSGNDLLPIVYAEKAAQEEQLVDISGKLKQASADLLDCVSKLTEKDNMQSNVQAKLGHTEEKLLENDQQLLHLQVEKHELEDSLRVATEQANELSKQTQQLQSTIALNSEELTKVQLGLKTCGQIYTKLYRSCLSQSRVVGIELGLEQDVTPDPDLMKHLVIVVSALKTVYQGWDQVARAAEPLVTRGKAAEAVLQQTATQCPLITVEEGQFALKRIDTLHVVDSVRVGADTLLCQSSTAASTNKLKQQYEVQLPLAPMVTNNADTVNALQVYNSAETSFSFEEERDENKDHFWLNSKAVAQFCEEQKINFDPFDVQCVDHTEYVQQQVLILVNRLLGRRMTMLAHHLDSVFLQQQETISTLQHSCLEHDSNVKDVELKAALLAEAKLKLEETEEKLAFVETRIHDLSEEGQLVANAKQHLETQLAESQTRAELKEQEANTQIQTLQLQVDELKHALSAATGNERGNAGNSDEEVTNMQNLLAQRETLISKMRLREEEATAEIADLRTLLDKSGAGTMEYLKNVIMQYIASPNDHDNLFPVLEMILKFSPEEKKLMEAKRAEQKSALAGLTGLTGWFKK